MIFVLFQIKIAGNRVDLIEVELILKQHCNYNQPLVVYVENDAQIVLFLEATEKAIELDRFQLAKHLPSYAVPSKIVTVAAIPRLVSGKINRRQLIDTIGIVGETKTKTEQIESDRYQAFFTALEEVGIPRAHLDRNFFAAGGSSLNALSLIAKLHRIGFFRLTVERLLGASTLNDILLHEVHDARCHPGLFFESDSKYQIVSLKQIDKREAFRIIIESFVNSEQLNALIHRNDADLKLKLEYEWVNLLDDRWSTDVAAGLSFGIVDSDGRLLGIAVSNDAAHEPYINVANVPLLAPVLTMLEAGEEKLLERLRSHDTLPESILHNFLTTVNPDVAPEQRVIIMYYIERQLLQIAADNRFQAILTSNTSSVTQQLAEHVFKYEENFVLSICQWRDSSGSLVFPHADIDKTVMISIKRVA